MNKNDLEKAREIVQKMVDNTTWCCEFNSDYTMVEKYIAQALASTRESALEEAAKVADAYNYGLADENIPDDKESAYNKGCEDSKVDIAYSIRNLKSGGGR